ncbi:peptidoglycan-associated lipoprotein Pal [Ramlibacter sp. 2FC]|uniref:peptidoglycan-associated lipoprotein Pal n=1 Tax=Ramlibacter sp. 2FC TaxID=2502188 RepID=UPI0010FA1A97|nr:peptidoglycan-associated lipoprotein Pal [Ramlibacter sp. 2FC]
MKRFFLAFAMVAVLAGCGSSVKLDQPPVEDRAGSSAGAQGAGGSGAGQSGVAPVDLTKSAQNGVGPAGTANVVYFDFDSFVVKPEYQSVVESHARFLRASQARKVMLEGHTDERGGREYNLALGQKRAEAVRRAMGLLGVGDAQVEAVSFGEEKPAATGSDEAAWAKNRRVEFKYR